MALLTNLPMEFTTGQLAGLYYRRWEIEKKYHTLKNKIKFECVTGKASIYVYQDFYAQILVYNMVQYIRKCADYEVETAEHQKKKNCFPPCSQKWKNMFYPKENSPGMNAEKIYQINIKTIKKTVSKKVQIYTGTNLDFLRRNIVRIKNCLYFQLDITVKFMMLSIAGD